MKRCIAGLLAIALLAGCSNVTAGNSGLTSAETKAPATAAGTTTTIQTQPTNTSQPASTRSSASPSTQGEIRADLLTGETYQLKSLEIAFQNLYRSIDKAGREGILIEFTTKWKDEIPGEELPQLEVDVLQNGKRVKVGGNPPGHELVNYKAMDLLPGATLQHLMFFETEPDQTLEITLQTVLKDTAGYRLKSAYPAEFADLAELGEKLKKERLDLNKKYLSEVPDKEDLSLIGQTIDFPKAEFIIREIKTVPNDILGGRDLIVSYVYKRKPAQERAKDDYLDIQIQAFQYGVETGQRFIDQDARPTNDGFMSADFIVNYKDRGALVIRIFGPTLRKALVFVPEGSDGQ